MADDRDEAGALVRTTWLAAVSELAGHGAPDRSADAETEVDRSARQLLDAYTAEGRHYHDLRHIAQVITDSAALCMDLGVTGRSRAAVLVAGCAHDVVYTGSPSTDERASAAWADRVLAAAGVQARDRMRVSDLVLATIDHTVEPDDMAGWALLDADLAILGSDPERYRRYRLDVRAEYGHVTDDDWRRGRAAVLGDLLERDPLFCLEPARRRWQDQARQNMADELAGLRNG